MLIQGLIFILFLPIIQSLTTLSMNSALSPNTIGATSQLTITVSASPSFEIPVGSVFILSFPSAFVNSNPTCSVTAFPVMPLSSPCISANSQITMNSAHITAASYFSIIVIVSGFINPSAIDYSGYFAFQINDSGGNVLAQTSATANYQVALAKARLNQCQFISSSNDIVGTSTNLVLYIKTVNNIPAGGVIRISTPIWDNFALDPNLKYFAQSTVACTAMSSNVAASVTCAFDSSTGNITIKNGFSVLTIGEITIGLKNMRTPLNTGPSPNFQVTTYTSSGTALEYYDTLNFTVSTPGTLTDWSISCQSTKINSAGYCTILFNTATSLPGPATIIITAPPEMKVQTPATLLYAMPSTNLDLSITPTISGSTMTLTNIVPSGQNVVGSSQIQIILATFQLPSSLAQTSSFSISTYSQGYKVDQASTEMYFQATQGGTITVNTLTADSLVAGQTTSYLFNLTLTSSVPSTGGIYIKFPSVFGLSSTCPLSSLSSNINSATVVCTVQSAYNAVVISNMFSTTLSSSQTIYFKVSGIRNPQSTEPTSALLIQSLQSSTDLTSGIDQNQTMTVSFITPGALALGSVIITPDSQLTSDVTTYNFRFTNTNPCPIGGKIEVRITQGVISFPLVASTLSSLVPVSNINSLATVSLEQTPTVYSINITNAFDSLHASGTQFSFNLSFIQNPPTTQPFSGTTILTYTVNNYIIDKLNTPATFQVSTPHPFANVRISASTLQNGLSGTYFIEITLNADHYNNDKFTILFPTTLDLNLNSAVLLPGLGSGNTISNFYQSGNSAIITLSVSGSSLPATTKILFSIGDLKNTVFDSPIGQFSIISSDSQGFLRSRSLFTNSSLVTQPALLSFPGTTLVLSNTILRETNTIYEFKINRTNSFGDGGSIEIGFPAEITAPSPPSCSNVAGITGMTCVTDVTGNTITVTGIFDDVPALLAVAINGVTNPNVNISGSFSITTETSASVIVDRRTTDLRFNADCDPPCKQCTGTRTTCTSCFDDSSSLLQYLSGNTCVQYCPSGTIGVNGVCISCTSPCAECSTTISQCTKCQSTPTQLYLYNAGCVSTCPATMYMENSTYTCANCSSKCSTCQDFDKCLTCPASKKLYNSDCINSCPASISIDTGAVCQPCDSNCATCSVTVDNCPSCKTGYIQYNNKCLDECPAAMYFDSIANTCLSCTTPCQNCTGTSGTCTSCISGKYLYLSTCVDTCTSGYYADSTTNKCLSCPNTCQTCTNSTNCNVCKSSNFLYLGTCVSSCPAGTFANGQVCSQCASGCSSCSGSSSNCQSCTTDYTLIGTTCSPNCPTGTYMASTFGCKSCNLICSSCSGPSADECSACNDPYLLYKTSCLAQCPQSVSIKDGKACKACNTGCSACSGTVSNCTSCVSGYTFIQDTSTCEATVTLGSEIVPFPFLIAAFVLGIFLIGGKTINSDTMLSSSLIACWSFVLFTAVVTEIVLKIIHKTFSLNFSGEGLAISLITFGLIINYINNIIHFYLASQLPNKNTDFQKWLENPKNSQISSILLILALFTTFNVYKLTYSRLMGWRCLSADLRSTMPLRPIHYLTVWHILTSILLTFIGASHQLSDGQFDNQITITSVEIVVLCVILCLLYIYEMLNFQNMFARPAKIAHFDDKSMVKRENEESITKKDQNKSNIGLLQDESRLDSSAVFRLDTFEANQTSQHKSKRGKVFASEGLECPERMRKSKQKRGDPAGSLKQSRYDNKEGYPEEAIDYEAQNYDLETGKLSDSNNIFLKSQLGEYVVEDGEGRVIKGRNQKENNMLSQRTDETLSQRKPSIEDNLDIGQNNEVEVKEIEVIPHVTPVETKKGNGRVGSKEEFEEVAIYNNKEYVSQTKSNIENNLNEEENKEVESQRIEILSPVTPVETKKGDVKVESQEEFEERGISEANLVQGHENSKIVGNTQNVQPDKTQPKQSLKQEKEDKTKGLSTSKDYDIQTLDLTDEVEKDRNGLKKGRENISRAAQRSSMFGENKKVPKKENVTHFDKNNTDKINTREKEQEEHGVFGQNNENLSKPNVIQQLLEARSRRLTQEKSLTKMQKNSLKNENDFQIVDLNAENDFSEDSDVSIKDSRNFDFEDTPSNYNDLNLRFTEGSYRYESSRNTIGQSSSHRKDIDMSLPSPRTDNFMARLSQRSHREPVKRKNEGRIVSSSQEAPHTNNRYVTEFVRGESIKGKNGYISERENRFKESYGDNSRRDLSKAMTVSSMQKRNDLSLPQIKSKKYQ